MQRNVCRNMSLIEIHSHSVAHFAEREHPDFGAEEKTEMASANHQEGNEAITEMKEATPTGTRKKEIHC